MPIFPICLPCPARPISPAFPAVPTFPACPACPTLRSACRLARGSRMPMPTDIAPQQTSHMRPLAAAGPDR